MKRKVGRPRIVETPEEFDTLVDSYVVKCRMEDSPMSTVGLALHMGFCDKGTLSAYGNEPNFEEFRPSVKRARSIIEQSWTNLALKGGGAGPIFLLKAVYNYVDRQAVDVNQTGEIKVVMSEKDAKL